MNHSLESSIPCDRPDCGKPIKFITLKKNGKIIPVDPQMIIAKTGAITGNFILPNGEKVITLNKGQCGYRSHFETCGKKDKK